MRTVAHSVAPTFEWAISGRPIWFAVILFFFGRSPCSDTLNRSARRRGGEAIMEIVDAQIHATHRGLEQSVAAMDAMGVSAAVLDDCPATRQKMPKRHHAL